jgi:hypothetical protein
MDSHEVGQLCEELRKLVDSGPGRNPEARRKALSIVATLKGAGPPHLRGGLVSMEGGFKHWFGSQERGIDNEWHTRSGLLEDISVVQARWDRPAPPVDFLK